MFIHPNIACIYIYTHTTGNEIKVPYHLITRFHNLSNQEQNFQGLEFHFCQNPNPKKRFKSKIEKKKPNEPITEKPLI